MSETKKTTQTKSHSHISNVSLRDFFAAEAMNSIISSTMSNESHNFFAKMAEMKMNESFKAVVARISYEVADAMIVKKHES